MYSPRVESIYQRVLGERFDLLDPGLRRYFGAIPEGSTGVGRGVYAVAGSRLRVLRPALAVLARRRVLFPELESDVPFTVVNRNGPGGSLRGIRSFHFSSRSRIMEDSMTAVGDRIVDRLGRRGGLEAVFAIDVVDGGLRMTSDRLATWILGCRVPLPRFATVTVAETWSGAQQHVDVRVRSPLVGEIFRYTGSFTYEHVPIDEIGDLAPRATSS